MADIFLSYAREDKERARLFARAFEAQAWSVFWDPRILPGTSWDEVIEAELESCRCVVVLWSVTSVSSKWVKSEATFGDDKGILVPVALDGATPPLKFRYIQSAQLQAWAGDTSDDAFAHLLDGIARHAPHPLKKAPAALAPPKTRSIKPRSSRSRPEAIEASAETMRVAFPPTAPVALPLRRFREDAWHLPDEHLLGFVEIPPGEFLMGSDKSLDHQAFDDELPQHSVWLPRYFIGRYEVTVGQFRACVADGGCQPGDHRALAGPDDLPVRYVSWEEALAYCKWLDRKLRAWDDTPVPLADTLAGRRGGVAFHATLPSEAEWEKGARGADGRIFPWGQTIDGTKANYSDGGSGAPMPVGSFPQGASPFGLLDMSGNVCEWTRSCYRPYPYRADDGREDLVADDNTRRVVRDGSFSNTAGVVRAAVRRKGGTRARNKSFGFRVVVSPLSPGTT